MGKPTQQQQQQGKQASDIIMDETSAAAAAAANDENCFLNPTLAAFNFGNLYYCNFCGFSANNTNKILHHLFVHVFKCSSCNHFTYTKYDLMKHIYKYHRPNKELKIKRLVLEVTSNDWYFLCSENDAHNLTSCNDAENNFSSSNGACFNVNSIDTSSTTGKTASGLYHTRLVQSAGSNDDRLDLASGRNAKSKQPVTNFFLPKVQKSPEKLTQVIQRNVTHDDKSAIQADLLNTSNTSDNSTSGGGASSQLKKLMNKDTNPTSKIIIPSINSMKPTQTTTMTTTSASSQNKTSSISALINTPGGCNASYNQKLMGYMQEPNSLSNSAPSSLIAGKAKRQIKKPMMNMHTDGLTPKLVKKPKKYTDDSMFSSETKKDLESIKNKYANMKCKYTCNQCNFEVDDAVTAYSHVIKTNDSHLIKCCACDVYSNDNVCSYKMHLLSKHKFYASADKLFHEFFTITNLDTGENMCLDTPLHTLVATAMAAAKANEALAAAQAALRPLSHQDLASKLGSSYDDEKVTTLKRALIDANIIVSPSNEGSELAMSTAAYTKSLSSKKMRFIVDEASSNSDKALSDHKGAISNDDEMDHHERHSKGSILNQQQTSDTHVAYDTEELDDGNTIYICSKCKLVFLNINLLSIHKCFTLSSSNGNSINAADDDDYKDSALLAELDDKKSEQSEDSKSPAQQQQQQQQHTDADGNNKDVNQNDDYDMIKNNSDIIYIE